MTQFNWSEQLNTQALKSWLATQGAGVSIAALDTGVNLSHPALQRLRVAGRTFDAGQPAFHPSLIQQLNSADVTDAHRRRGHGTQCTGILSAVAEADNALLGIAPKSDIFIFKINTPDHQFFLIRDFLKALEAAALLKTDLIVCSISFAAADVEAENIAPTEVERVFGLVRQSGALLVSALPNVPASRPWVGLAAKNFPSQRPESINVGAVTQAIFQQRQAEIDALPDVHFLASDAPGVFCNLQNGYDQSAVSSSHAAYIVAGVGALYLAFLKKKMKAAYLPPGREDFMKGMGRKFARLGGGGAWQPGQLTLFKTDVSA